MQSLAALAHFDFNLAGAYAYEQAFQVMPPARPRCRRVVEQQFRRMVFNVVARNQDDHVKNIAFLMDTPGTWSLSPPHSTSSTPISRHGRWTSQHQMTLNGKRDGFTLGDFHACARVASLKRGRAQLLLGEISDVVSRWPAFAAEAGVVPRDIERIARTHRLTFPE